MKLQDSIPLEKQEVFEPEVREGLLGEGHHIQGRQHDLIVRFRLDVQGRSKGTGIP